MLRALCKFKVALVCLHLFSARMQACGAVARLVVPPAAVVAAQSGRSTDEAVSLAEYAEALLGAIRQPAEAPEGR